MNHEILVQELESVRKMPVLERLRLARTQRLNQIQNYLECDRQNNEEILSKEKLHRKTKIQFTIEDRLFNAVIEGNIEEAAKLLKEGANPNTKNYEGLTPLHQCCIDGNIEMAKLFLQNGSYVNATDMDRWTPSACSCNLWSQRFSRMSFTKWC
ncbi:Protein phosphatase 1 regulatory inhibitor subunit 16B [Armadillidium vulgare]|nr:Protein phosphatase 1 regulatory inhibitor subunit 16B [Armadillidium vulgare]